MRIFLLWLLAIMLSLNASYAASMAICDVLEQAPDHVMHFGHHNHGEDGSASEATGQLHAHDHAHPGFSSIVPGSIGIATQLAYRPQFSAAACTYRSAPQTLPDPPPRAA